MRILRLLNKVNLSIIIFSLFVSFGVVAEEEPVDIWNLDKEEQNNPKNSNSEDPEEKKLENSIYDMQNSKQNKVEIELDEELASKEVEIFGIYDPADNGLNINMWKNSDGEKIISLFNSLDKIELSRDASEILSILLLTNSYFPEKNITKEQFSEIISNWLIKNSDFAIIENYLVKNQIINIYPKLTKFLVNNYLSNSNIKKSCEFFSKINKPIEDDYLSKFNIYCLINDNKMNEAQLLLDLKKELGFKDKFFEKKINFLLGFKEEADKEISEKNIFEFHLSHKVNKDFKFEPNDQTSKQIWKYLSTSNLLGNIQDIELTNLQKISSIEKATHDKNYQETELYELYKRFQFNINQLINIEQSHKMLNNVEGRALIYQGILITSEPSKKILLMEMLKNSFIKDDISDAFDQELQNLLDQMEKDKIPKKYENFYNNFVKKSNEKNITNIKINNKILHQSKLINYFRDDYSEKNIEKDLNDLLKKIKRDKKYFFSKKDIILVEALKSDGVKVDDKYKNLYKVNDSEIPSDIQDLIDKGDMGTAILRIVQVLGQDQIKDIDIDTMYFIINVLSQLDIDPLRNKFILKVLPLKV